MSTSQIYWWNNIWKSGTYGWLPQTGCSTWKSKKIKKNKCKRHVRMLLRKYVTTLLVHLVPWVIRKSLLPAVLHQSSQADLKESYYITGESVTSGLSVVHHLNYSNQQRKDIMETTTWKMAWNICIEYAACAWHGIMGTEWIMHSFVLEQEQYLKK